MKKIILILLISLVVFSGCGTTQEDCKKLDTTYKKYYYDKDSGSCFYKTLKKNVCGNGVIEDGETYCNCPKDVLKDDPNLGCEGTIGKYIEKQCNSKTKKCGFYQNKKVVTETKVLDFKNSDVHFTSEIKLNKPFIENTDDKNVIRFRITLFNFMNDKSIKISNINIKSITLLNSNNLLFGSFNFNKPLSKLGESLPEVSFKLNDISQYYSKEPLKAKLVVTYRKDLFDSKGKLVKSENKVISLIQSIGYLEIINPNLYEQKN